MTCGVLDSVGHILGGPVDFVSRYDIQYALKGTLKGTLIAVILLLTPLDSK